MEQQILVKNSGMRTLGSHYYMRLEGQEKKLFNEACRELKTLEMGHPVSCICRHYSIISFLSPEFLITEPLLVLSHKPTQCRCREKVKETPDYLYFHTSVSCWCFVLYNPRGKTEGKGT